MMQIDVLVFAHLREELGFNEITLDLHSMSVSVRDAVQEVLGAEKFKRNKSHLRYAVNEMFVDQDYMLSDGDILALIPPVSGG